MQINNRKILLIIISITILTIPIVYFSSGAVRIIFSLIVLLFFPGYTLLTAVFPKHSEIRLNERIALSLGISIAVVPVIGLILHYTPWGLELNSIFITTTTFIIVTGALGWYRGARVFPEVPLSSSTRSSFGWHYLKKLSKPDKTLTFAFAAVIVVFLGVLAYAAFTPNKGENYTEFYILDAQGSTDNYPGEITHGTPVQLIVGVISHEEIPTEYHIEINVNGKLVNSPETGILAQNEKWQDTISFLPEYVGDGQKVELWLYKQGDSQPYNQNSLHFYIDVNE